MAYRYLDEFNTDTHVEARTAKHDKIELNIGTWMFNGDAETIDQIATRLTQAVNFYRDEHGHRYRFRIFNRGVRGRGNQRTINFIATGEPHFPVGRPLVQGQIKLRIDASSASCFAEAKLTINPTRALEQTGASLVFQAHTNNTEYEVAMFRRVGVTHSAEEIPLRASDNYISNMRLIRTVYGQRWMRFLSAYLDSVDQSLQNHFQTAFNAENIAFHFNPEYNLKKLETYWEFQHRDPIWLMNQISPVFLSLGKSGHLTEYSIDPNVEMFPRREINQNSPLVKIDITNNVAIKAYAKTTRRIRFEVETKTGRDRHTSHSLDDIIRMIDNHSEDAANRMNHVIRNLTQAIGDGIEQSPPYELIEEIFSATDDPDERRLLLSSLVIHGGYTRINNQPINEAFDRLRNRGVVHRVAPRSSAHVLTQRFQRARILLSGNWEEFATES